jgi:hypothetical protein
LDLNEIKSIGFEHGLTIMPLTFKVEVEVLACHKHPSERRKSFTIYPVGLSEKLVVDVNSNCECDCEADHSLRVRDALRIPNHAKRRSFVKHIDFNSGATGTEELHVQWNRNIRMWNLQLSSGNFPSGLRVYGV